MMDQPLHMNADQICQPMKFIERHFVCTVFHINYEMS